MAFPKVNESIVMKDVDYALDAYGIFHWRNNVGAARIGPRFIRYGYPGSSDWLGICPDGRFLAVECKAPQTGRLTDSQRDFIDRINYHNGVALVVSGLGPLLEQLQERGVIG